MSANCTVIKCYPVVYFHFFFHEEIGSYSYYIMLCSFQARYIITTYKIVQFLGKSDFMIHRDYSEGQKSCAVATPLIQMPSNSST